MKRHVHADLIKLWAEGVPVQVQEIEGWVTVDRPTWRDHLIYRVDPNLLKEIEDRINQLDSQIDSLQCEQDELWELQRKLKELL